MKFGQVLAIGMMNLILMKKFISVKLIEGCGEKSLKYYEMTFVKSDKKG
ncbi:MAG: hypothetical protein LBB45_05540 [Methanobrevibacter sp.]|jgi:hypothetical protein|nr:hypothetical protein [Candidatus Methanovirga basalitermitum]